MNLRNRYFARGLRVYISFHEPAGVRQEIFCTVPKDKEMSAIRIAESLNDTLKNETFNMKLGPSLLGCPSKFDEMLEENDRLRWERDNPGRGRGFVGDPQ